MKDKRFVVYKLQKLAILLRILGFDVLYFQNEDYVSVINLTKREYRILLSRVKFLRKLPWIFYLDKDDLDRQLEQIIKELKLKVNKESLFSRCSNCNNILQEVQEEEVTGEIPLDVCGRGYWFKRCLNCGKIFWNGNHMITLKEKFKKLNILEKSDFPD
ncbi:MAG: Mut7-C RNAse domain-containing protein [Candidatus Caldatribacteriota bacterium]|nr:Mut7-C RNAse domain-containing protein [Candidatus Caldatribacteriota bacterium]